MNGRCRGSRRSLSAQSSARHRHGPSDTASRSSASAIDRFQLTAWAMLRNQQTGVAGSLAGERRDASAASQAGARLTYDFNRQIAAIAAD